MKPFTPRGAGFQKLVQWYREQWQYRPDSPTLIKSEYPHIYARVFSPESHEILEIDPDQDGNHPLVHNGRAYLVGGSRA